MTQEALKLALEFVKSINLGSRSASVEQQRQVITALEEALAQTQEPVAMWDGKYQIEFGNLSAYKHGEHSWIPLYTSPPPQRSESSGKPSAWVGLTKKEILLANEKQDESIIAAPDDELIQFARAIEAKLKELNT